MIVYGLHPTLWRFIRKNHSGGMDFTIRNKGGKALGVGMVSRFESIIYLQKSIGFKELSIKRLVLDTRDKYLSKCLIGDILK